MAPIKRASLNRSKGNKTEKMKFDDVHAPHDTSGNGDIASIATTASSHDNADIDQRDPSNLSGIPSANISPMNKSPTQLMTILAGDTSIQMSTSKVDALIRQSEFFRALLTSQSWLENKTSTINFPDDNGFSVSAFVLWCRTHKFPDVSKRSFRVIYETLINAHLFGEKIMAPQFCEVVRNQIYVASARDDYALPMDIIRYAYDNTLDTSPLRTFLAKHWCEQAGYDGVKNVTTQFLHPDFCHSVIGHLLEYKEQGLELNWKKEVRLAKRLATANDVVYEVGETVEDVKRKVGVEREKRKREEDEADKAENERVVNDRKQKSYLDLVLNYD